MTDNLAQLIPAEQVRLLYRGSIRSVSINYPGLVMLGILLYGKVENYHLLIAMSMIFLVTTARLWLALKGSPYDQPLDNPEQKLKQYVPWVGLQGLVWGLCVAWFHYRLPAEYEAILLMFSVVAIAVTMITYSTSRLVFFVFVSAGILPQVIALLLRGGEMQIMMSFLLVASCIILANVFLWNYNCLAKAITISFEKHALMDSLERANRDLASSNENLTRLQYQLTAAVLTDELTGIANRRHFNNHLESEWRRARRNGSPLSLCMIDIDYFKNYNDHYWHQQGDECLKTIAQTISMHMKRPADLAARYGGEEFAVILPDTPLQSAQQLAEQIRDSVAALKIQHDKSPYQMITISAGVAGMVPDDDNDWKMLVMAADEALYRAKSAGRNRIVAA